MLAADRHTVALAAGSDLWTDVATFDALATQATPESLAAAAVDQAWRDVGL